MEHQTCAPEYKYNQAGAPKISLICKASEVLDAWAIISYSGLGFGGDFWGFFYILDTKHQEFHLHKNSHHELSDEIQSIMAGLLRSSCCQKWWTTTYNAKFISAEKILTPMSCFS